LNINIELKARCSDPDHIRKVLQGYNARHIGTDFQEDVYFNVQHGRLKLRTGNIENNLIYYQRPDTASVKQSDFQLVEVSDHEGLKQVLSKSLGVFKVIRKKREIYFIDNVKFHIDEVQGLGSFVEIEAGNLTADKTVEELQVQCNFYKEKLGIQEKDLIDQSYSDLLK
jgi:adenylate cyclase, class 2